MALNWKYLRSCSERSEELYARANAADANGHPDHAATLRRLAHVFMNEARDYLLAS